MDKKFAYDLLEMFKSNNAISVMSFESPLDDEDLDHIYFLLANNYVTNDDFKEIICQNLPFDKPIFIEKIQEKSRSLLFIDHFGPHCFK